MLPACRIVRIVDSPPVIGEEGNLLRLRQRARGIRFDAMRRHLRQLRFRGGVPVSAQLGRDNSGTGYVLRASSTRRTWKERIGVAPRTVYSFAIPPRDEAGAQALSEITSRASNRVASVCSPVS